MPPFLVLDLLPRDEKNPPVFPGVSFRKEEVLTREDVREGGASWVCARDGYGRGGGAVGAMVSPFDLNERSVATDASARLGNVASEITDDPEICLGCGVRAATESAGPAEVRVR